MNDKRCLRDALTPYILKGGSSVTYLETPYTLLLDTITNNIKFSDLVLSHDFRRQGFNSSLSLWKKWTECDRRGIDEVRSCRTT